MSLAAWAAVCYGLAILGGATMLAIRHTTGRNPPRLVAVAHGTAVLAGFATLGIAVAEGAGGPALAALILFAGTAVGGVMLLVRDLRGRLLPITYVVLHGGMGVTAYFFLILYLVGSDRQSGMETS
jgi:hypothetical protein